MRLVESDKFTSMLMLPSLRSWLTVPFQAVVCTVESGNVIACDWPTVPKVHPLNATRGSLSPPRSLVTRCPILKPLLSNSVMSSLVSPPLSNVVIIWKALRILLVPTSTRY